MTTTCTITTRPASTKELAHLRYRCQNTFVSSAMGLPIGFFIGYGIGVAMGLDQSWCVVIAVAWVLACIASMHGALPMHRRRARDLSSKEIEVVEVANVKPVSLPDRDPSEDPSLAFELPGERVLLLVGDWQSETETFGATPRAAEDGYQDETFDTYANHLQPPWSFPTSAFRVARFAATGVVVGIEVLGPYAPPDAVANMSALRIPNPRQSYLLNTNMDKLADALRRDRLTRGRA